MADIHFLSLSPFGENGLKLKRKGFSGKFLMSIVALVNNVLQIPKINGKLLPPIVTSTGLKQGDNLSQSYLILFWMMLNLYLTQNVSLWY